MKRLLLPLLAALALPTAVNANWFGDKIFYLICNTSVYKAIFNGSDIFGGWQKSPNTSHNGDYGLFKLNEKNMMK